MPRSRRRLGAFLIRRLAPLHANIGKRLVKSPQVYWRDSGLVHALLDLVKPDDLMHAPWVGASWEGDVVEQALGVLAATGTPCTPSFFRTSDGREIDLVLDFGGKRWAIETKLTAAPSDQDLARVDAIADLIEADRRILVSRTSEVVGSGRRVSANLPWLLRELEG